MKRLIPNILLLILIFSFASISTRALENTSKPLYGDVDMDYQITVKDATLIQKSVAGLCRLSAPQRFVVKTGDDNITVKNATEIQKYVASLTPNNTRIGTETENSDYDVFSELINPESDFEDDTIIVIPKDGFSHEYTLDDFMEYEFETLTPLGEYPEDQCLGYTLTIKEPSKNNVVEAIKALNYRSGYDLMVVSPNYIYTLE